MASSQGGEKKISFSFSKSMKKPILGKTAPPEKKVDFIECLDSKAIKVIGGEEKIEGPLVIPMLGSKTWHERILNKVNADVFEPKVEPTTNGDLNNVEIKQEIVEDASGNTIITMNNEPQPMEVVTVKEEKPDVPVRSLEEQAAHEILQDLKSKSEDSDDKKIAAVPLPEDESLLGKKESTLEDYENIPIDKFGEAMLRGMGWQPGKGIGKNEKFVEAVQPELRPRGMGLGADKAMIKKQIEASKLAEEGNLKVVKGAYIKIISGKQSGNYGQIEGIDDDGGRLDIKLALGGDIISVNESMIQVVSTNEYNKNAKVLNSKKYEDYQNKTEKKKNPSPEEIEISDDSEEDQVKRGKDRDSKSKDRNGRSRDRKKSKKHKRYSSEDGSDSDRGSRKRRNSSDSDQKKSKKHKRYSSDEDSDREPRKRRNSCESDRKKSKKYKRYSSEEDSDRESRKRRNSSDSDQKKPKKHKRYSSDDDSDSDRGSRRRKNSSDSDSDHKRKKSKKTKKHKRRDDSQERSSHKSKRKHKERDRETRDSPKRDRYRHKRSRSRSPRRR